MTEQRTQKTPTRRSPSQSGQASACPATNAPDKRRRAISLPTIDTAPSEKRQEPMADAPTREIPRIPDAASNPSPLRLEDGPTNNAVRRRAANEYTPTRRAQKPIEPWKKNAAIAAAVVLVLAIVYSGGIGFFQSHLFPNTNVGGTNLGMMTYEEANAKLPQCVTNYSLTITGDGMDATVASAELGLTPTNATIESLNLQGNPTMWPIELFAPHSAPASTVATFDESVLNATISKLVSTHNRSAEPTSDASISYDATSNSWKVKEASVGTALKEESVLSKAKSAVTQWQTKVTLGNEDLALSADGSSPTATTAQLQKQADQFNKLFDFNFTLKLGNSGTLAINRRFAPDWTTVDADYNVTFSQEKFDQWCDLLASSLDTVGGSRTYTRADGKQVSVDGGTYGWKVDPETLLAAVNQGISSNSKGTIEVTCIVEGNGYKGPYGPDFGYYVDVDITEQYAIVYDENDKILWETDVITGWDNGYYDTPTGVYVINSKESPSVLQSSLTSTVTNADGTTEEVTLTFRHDVSYWMPFISNFIGFHDATWQTQGWGGDLYHYEATGSGGCVNLPLEMAASLWDLVEVGTVVSVHF